VHSEAVALARLDTEPTVPLARLELPRLIDGVDLGGLYTLAETLYEQGARTSTAVAA
jgi:hypothetical protein